MTPGVALTSAIGTKTMQIQRTILLILITSISVSFLDIGTAKAAEPECPEIAPQIRDAIKLIKRYKQTIPLHCARQKSAEANESTLRDEYQSRKCYVMRRGRTEVCKQLVERIQKQKKWAEMNKTFCEYNKERLPYWEKRLSRLKKECENAKWVAIPAPPANPCPDLRDWRMPPNACSGGPPPTPAAVEPQPPKGAAPSGKPPSQDAGKCEETDGIFGPGCYQ